MRSANAPASTGLREHSSHGAVPRLTSTWAEIGKRIGEKALKRVAYVAKADTILAWYRRLIAQKFEVRSTDPIRDGPGSHIVTWFT
jgi:hypothetical protein